ncbi:MAG: hypothetical protein PWP65_67 [Clostridia bacterium]|nr:hypothetical protein [Clostridia bacterium]
MSLTSIIIPVLNQWPYTRLCLESIERFTPEAHEIIIVDNGSTDATPEKLKRRQGVRLICLGKNHGFAAAVNRGLAVARGNYLLLLNNDVVVTPRWLSNMLAGLEVKPRAGLVGPRSNYVGGRQLLPVRYQNLEEMIAFARDFNSPDLNRWFQVEMLVGFCLLFKREVLERVGYLDERFWPGNFEDNDYSLRARLAGYELWCAGDVFVHHFGSVTFRGEQIDLSAAFYQNQARYLAKWGKE